MSDQAQAQVQSENQSHKATVSAEALLKTYVEMWNDSNGTATLQDVADMLEMEVNNVYQRMLKIRKDLEASGVKIPLMKRSNSPSKSAKRVDLGKLAALAQTIRVVEPAQPAETPEIA